MKKINSSGFVLAETLVVTVFLMAIFAMIYSSFVPLIGEYEKRENYDSVDGKYAVYWLKRMIEDSSYNIPAGKENDIKDKGYVRFECQDVSMEDEKREYCVNMVKNLQVTGCDNSGNNCEIFITRYCLDDASDTSRKWFKQAVREDAEKKDNKVFRSGFRDYVFFLPDYTAESLNYANYRVIASFHNKKDNNNYYSYATIEVNR